MLAFLARRLAGLALVMWLVTTLVFFLLRFSPGSPLFQMQGFSTSQESRDKLAEHLGLDDPLPVQYAHYLGRLLHGDLGRSIYNNRTVTSLITGPLAVTLELALVTALVWVAIGILLGALAAARPGGFLDGLVRVGSVVVVSIPSFWLGVVCVIVFGVRIPGVLPSSGWVPFGEDPVEHLRCLVLPVFVLGLGAGGIVARTMRASLADALRSDHVAYARAAGLPERTILWRVAARGALLPTTTVAGLMMGMLVSGTVLVESVFRIPGMGRLTVGAFAGQDYPLATGCSLTIALVFLLCNLVADLVQFRLDPRLRASLTRRRAGTAVAA
ncbi:ABC transporter permease [Yinghuangia seranimata]|uniref:ABC transporter permease n=1 Tax=Yinghuangia seranimata TaxID=408067 RepID=UPI00248C2D25|nr:ABC transporter permease [Yinghuangia seranimata]MDI2124970.1 ABC transporter permease [Yinghuangia seranimata]